MGDRHSSSSFGDDGRAERLRTYDQRDRDELGQAKLERAIGNDEFRQNQAAMIEARKQAEIEAKAQHYQQLNEFKDQRLQQFQQASDIQKAHADLEAARMAAKTDTTTKILEHATGFLRDARGMDPSKPEFDAQYQKLLAGYPLAGEHPSVKEWSDYHRPLRDKFVAEEIARRKPENPRDYGTQTLGPTGEVVSTTRPVGAPGSPQEQAAAQAQLLLQHNALEKSVNAQSGEKQDPAKIAELNSIKAKLGFAQIDPVTLKSVAPAPVAAPVKIAAADDFHSLPSGAEFIDPQGVRRRKP